VTQQLSGSALRSRSNEEISQASIGGDGKASKLKIDVVKPEQASGPGGCRYSINNTESAAKEISQQDYKVIRK
jgi:hypothetical protein